MAKSKKTTELAPKFSHKEKSEKKEKVGFLPEPIKFVLAPQPTSTQGIIAYLIFLQALTGMLGSLYYSTFGDPIHNILVRNLFPVGNGLLPCELCWFARILLYPITLISLVGMLKEDRKFTDYVLPLSVIGICLETYHYALQRFNIASPFGCTLVNPCNALQVQYFGFITIPFLALLAFISITLLCIWNWRINKQREKKKLYA